MAHQYARYPGYHASDHVAAFEFQPGGPATPEQQLTELAQLLHACEFMYAVAITNVEQASYATQIVACAKRAYQVAMPLVHELLDHVTRRHDLRLKQLHFDAVVASVRALPSATAPAARAYAYRSIAQCALVLMLRAEASLMHHEFTWGGPPRVQVELGIMTSPAQVWVHPPAYVHLAGRTVYDLLSDVARGHSAAMLAALHACRDSPQHRLTVRLRAPNELRALAWAGAYLEAMDFLTPIEWTRVVRITAQSQLLNA